jgi:hypothetical protein
MIGSPEDDSGRLADQLLGWVQADCSIRAGQKEAGQRIADFEIPDSACRMRDGHHNDQK